MNFTAVRRVFFGIDETWIGYLIVFGKVEGLRYGSQFDARRSKRHSCIGIGVLLQWIISSTLLSCDL